MGWLIAGFVILVWGQGMALYKLHQMSVDMYDLKRKYANLFATRQGRISRTMTDTRSPQVDARAKTNRRDTFDIPTRGGKMSTAVHRKSSHASARTDA